MPSTSRRTAGILATTAGVSIWGASSIMVKSIEGIDAVGISFHRLLLGALLLVVVHLGRGGRIDWRMLRISAAGGVAFGLDIVLFFSALRETSVANATVIGALQPILLAPIGVRLFGERLAPRTVGWSVVAVAGTAVVVLGATGVPEWSLRGDLLAVGALLSWTAYFVASKQARQHLGTLEYFTGLSIVACAVVVPYALVVGADLSPAGPSDWVIIVLVTVFSGALGHVLLNWSHEHVPLQVISLLTLLVPVVATAGAVAFLGERVSGLQWAGMAVVLASLAVVVRERPAAEPREVGEPVPT
jgi:drug/metabolite transporter (DMT)-like permease